MAFLKVENIHTHINQFHILQGVSFAAEQERITVLLGRNGAGKTTTLKSIMGIHPITQGAITYKQEYISELPTYEIANKGIGYVPENQGIFGGLTVSENIEVAIKKKDEATMERLEWVVNLFPDLKTYYRKKGDSLSGGQKQMLAIARAYVNDIDLLLIDEPSKGLAPVMIEKVMASLMEIKRKTAVVLVEQNFRMASEIGDSYYILDEGKTVHKGMMSQLVQDSDIRRRFLGVS